jgi:hypothetical protein
MIYLSYFMSYLEVVRRKREEGRRKRVVSKVHQLG